MKKDIKEIQKEMAKKIYRLYESGKISVEEYNDLLNDLNEMQK